MIGSKLFRSGGGSPDKSVSPSEGACIIVIQRKPRSLGFKELIWGKFIKEFSYMISRGASRIFVLEKIAND